MPQKRKLLPEGVMESLSGMKGNFHVPFLEEGERVIALLYSADELDQMNLIADLTKEEYLGFVQREVALLTSHSMDT